MQIITDTREQRPLFPSCKRATLTVGDYTTAKLLNHFHIERKSLQDLYSTLIQGNARFKRELFRAAWFQIKMEIYVEGTREQFIQKQFPRGEERKCTTQKLDELIKTFEKVYYLKFCWHKDRAHCIKMVKQRLQAEESLLPLKTSKSGPKPR